MKHLIVILVTGYVLLFAWAVKSPHQVAAKPSMNGNNTPGCAGSGCHNLNRGIVKAEYVGNMKIRITLSNTTSKVAGEAVDRNGVVVAYNNSTSSNPFELTVSQIGVYKINAGYKNPSRDWDSTTVRVSTSAPVEEHAEVKLPNGFHLAQNYPNPFSAGAIPAAARFGATNISYSLPTATSVAVVVYDLTGREIRRLVDGLQSTGVHHIQWDGRDATGHHVAAGTYLYRLQAGQFSTARKMMLLD
jgi:flagellar hook assembly protein FlgD